ncbi:MAG TPA: aminotransferase class IV, partial [Acidisoma sp.]|nr:aminotransferase class IV [Acidisoma sp.]
MTLWLNGRFLPAGEALIDPTDRGFLLGDGIFETIRVVDGAPMHLAQHLARMRCGAVVLGIPVGWDDAALRKTIADVAKAAGLSQAAARLTLTRGPAPRGVLPPAEPSPTLMISAGALPPPALPAHAIIAATTKRNAFSPLSRIKSINYLDSIIARREAMARGADEAILLDTTGHLAEATAANLFLVIGDRIVTPPVEDGALPGITRGRLLAAGLAEEERLWPTDCAQAASAFLTNSLGLRTLTRIEDRR